MPGCSASEYPLLGRSWPTASEAKLSLGIGTRCRGHCARVVKTVAGGTFVKCRLSTSTPPCHWAAFLREVANGACEEWTPEGTGKDHCQESHLQGQRGFDSLEERQLLESRLISPGTSRPRAALYAARAGGRTIVASLPKIRLLKRDLHNKFFASKVLGDLVQATRGHTTVPNDPMQGFLCNCKITRDQAGKPKVNIVATTATLAHRWVEAGENCCVGMDGGFKFNVMGWPLTVIGQTNPKGNYSLHALALTSSLEETVVVDAVSSFANAASTITTNSVKKRFSMTDAELAYRNAGRKAFKAEALMCWFHVKQDIRKYLMRWIRQGTREFKMAIVKAVFEDLDWIRAARNPADFSARCGAMREKWEADGLVELTKHEDKGGKERHFASYFKDQWEDLVPDWYVGRSDGHMVPSTNNGAERRVGLTREDFGNKVGRVVEVISFILTQVEHASQEVFDPLAMRSIPDGVWLRAKQLATILGGPKIQCVHGVHCCWGRDHKTDVTVRKPMAFRVADRLVRNFGLLSTGHRLAAPDIKDLKEARCFSWLNSQPHCSCPAFAGPRFCLHTVALGLSLVFWALPPELDTTLVSTMRRGNKRRAPSCGAPGPVPDERDAWIKCLEERLALHAALALPQRRLRSKTCDDVAMRPVAF